MQADIFFFVSTILLSLTAIAFIVAVIYVIKIMREVRSVSRIIREETEKLAGDLDVFRGKVRDMDFTTQGLLGLAAGLFRKRKAERKNSSKNK